MNRTECLVRRALPTLLLVVLSPALSGQEVVLVGQGSPTRFLANVDTDPGIGETWTARAFVDAAWLEGTYGVGYEEAPDPPAGMIESVVPQFARSVFTRTRFTVTDLSQIETLHFGADFDDGYAAWLNGVEIARVNLPVGALAWDTAAATNHESSNASTAQYESVTDISAEIPLVVEGENVLAVGVWNVDATSSDLALVPLLSTNRPGPISGTDACGTLTADTTWTLAASPYTVTCDVIVPKGITLTIEAGVEVYVDPDVEIQVEGQIFAVGRRHSRIRFTRRDTGRWSGIDIDHAGDGEPRESVFRFVDFFYGSTLLDVAETGSSPILVEECAFDSWSSNAIDYDESNALRISYCDFGLDTPPENQGSETIHGAAASAVIEHCTFGRRRGYNDVLDIADTEWGGPVPTIQYNTFLGGDDDAIDLDGMAGWIIGNTLTGFWLREGAGGQANGGGITGTDGDPVVADNIVYGCYHGIGFKDGSRPLIVNNLIVDCHVGLTFYKADCDAETSEALAYNNIVWDNKYTEGPRVGESSNVVLHGGWYSGYCQEEEEAVQATIDMRYSIVGGNWPGEGNLDVDPQITDIAGRDFTLLPGSPAIDSAFGSPLSLLGIENRPDLEQLAAVLATDQSGAPREDLACVENTGGGEILFHDRGPLEASERVCDPPGTSRFLRGDANEDELIDIADAVHTLFVLYASLPTNCPDALDADDDGDVSLTDVLRVLNLVFQQGPVFPEPFSASGPDPSPDSLADCERDIA